MFGFRATSHIARSPQWQPKPIKIAPVKTIGNDRSGFVVCDFFALMEESRLGHKNGGILRHYNLDLHSNTNVTVLSATKTSPAADYPWGREIPMGSRIPQMVDPWTFPIELARAIENDADKAPQEAKEALEKAHTIIFRFPFLYPAVKKLVDLRTKNIVYSSENVEFMVRCRGEKEHRDYIRDIECDLIRNADLTIACCESNAGVFSHLGARWIEIIENGAPALFSNVHEDFRKEAVFVGSGGYPPNQQAIENIISGIAPFCPEWTFHIVSSYNTNTWKKDNVTFHGELSDEELNGVLHKCSVGLNTVPFGGGTSLKNALYLIAGLAVVGTNVGARGFKCDFQADDLSRICSFLNNLTRERFLELSEENATLGRNYTWENLRVKYWKHLSQLESLGQWKN